MSKFVDTFWAICYILGQFCKSGRASRVSFRPKFEKRFGPKMWSSQINGRQFPVANSSAVASNFVFASANANRAKCDKNMLVSAYTFIKLNFFAL